MMPSVIKIAAGIRSQNELRYGEMMRSESG
ncbi:MAG: hypothetical protein A4E51_01526 [Methanosaeta sp. PtaU1.Bin055]|nr:MAG: hypothetical protein A4E51_01526 [Methanosaeta sp. PtaU1.Bin055]